MTEANDEQRALRRSIAPRLGQLGTPLELIAEDVLGEEDGVIDWVAAAPDGRACVVLVAKRSGDAALLQAGLVQRAWVEARIPDWRKLAPTLAVREEPPAQLVLIAREFERATRIAAREAAGAAIVLARWHLAGTSGEIDLERVEPESRVARCLPGPAQRRPASAFRTGLCDADFLN
ncbi:MAG: hypothetical protein H6Q91_2452 [Deltaproteobacteria bacterium]|nr:hypothetical protein [Deltaproteobacteria bacterium]